jgi:hypothetical protein
MALTFEQVFAALCSELAATPSGTIEIFKQIAEPNVSEKAFGSLYLQALAYYTGHLITLDNKKRSAGSASNSDVSVGQLTKEKEGDLERQYSSVQMQVDTDVLNPLNSTLYGQEYNRMVKRIMPIMSRFVC